MQTETPPFLFGLFPYQVMFGLHALASGSGAPPKKIETDRNLDLENVLGNLLIAEYQVHRLKERLAGMLSVYARKGSSYQFKLNSSWFNVTVGAEKDVKIEPVVEPETTVSGGMPLFLAGDNVTITPGTQMINTSGGRFISGEYDIGVP